MPMPRGAWRVKTESTLHLLRKEAKMHAPVNHLGAATHARLVRELSDWLLGAAILMIVVSVAALAVAYGVLLIVL